MKVCLKRLQVTTKRTTESLDFSTAVTFLYGPVGTGKSTVARLIDYCLGGDLERTPAVQSEFISALLHIDLGFHRCTLERSATDTQSIRVSWSAADGDAESLNAPLDPGDNPIAGSDVYNFSDLLFSLCGVEPIKVRKRARDADSPMVRLSFRDVWWYCYLDQTHLDSSLFRLEDPFRGRKSQDAMRFFTGLHSELLSRLETQLYRAIDDQKGKREAANQIRLFMARFDLGSEFDLESRIESAKSDLVRCETRRRQVESDRMVAIHPTDPLRSKLRQMGSQLEDLETSIEQTKIAIAEQRALRAELITAKVRASRSEKAGALLSGVEYARCPECGHDVSSREQPVGRCRLCCSDIETHQSALSSGELEAVRRELNDRIDQIGDSIQRRERALAKVLRQADKFKSEKVALDSTLQQELSRYDSAFVESVRSIDRESATLIERIHSLERLREMPKAVDELEGDAENLEAAIDRVRREIAGEYDRLRRADANIVAIADRLKAIMLSVGFPGVAPDDKVMIDTQTWRPSIQHGEQEWTFWNAGSGGKKTLFNVCYALAIHATAQDRNLPVPNVLIIDSPTKNISNDENPELVKALYREIYKLAYAGTSNAIQFLLIDSDLVKPEQGEADFMNRHMAGEPNAPSLIPYYDGP